MSIFNNDVLQALEIKNQYLAHNINTKEVAASYDPKTKCRFFKKVEIDPQAILFKKKFIKSKIAKEKPLNTKIESKRKPGRPPKTNKENKVKVKQISNVNQIALEKRKSIHELALEGKSVDIIATTVSLSETQVYRHLKALNFKRAAEIKPDTLLLMEKILEFCKFYKSNLFFTRYNTSFKVYPEMEIKRLGYCMTELTKKTDTIKELKLGLNKNYGRCFRIFSNEGWSEEYLKK